MVNQPVRKAQQRAIDRFRAYLNKECSPNLEYGDRVTVFEQTPTTYGTVWISARTDMTGLSENNLLRSIAAQYWHVHVGKNGAIEVWNAPKCFDQFRGRRAFGMFFKKLT